MAEHIKFVLVSEAIMATRKITPLERLILGIVDGYAHAGKDCWLTNEQLAHEFEVTAKTAGIAVAKLCEKKLLGKEVNRSLGGRTQRRLFSLMPSGKNYPTVESILPYRQVETTLPSGKNYPTRKVETTLNTKDIYLNNTKEDTEIIGAAAPTPPPSLSEKPKKEKAKHTIFDLNLTLEQKRQLGEVYDRAIEARKLLPEQLPDKKAFLRQCCEECRDWSVSGGKKKADWVATLRNWIRRAVKDYRPPQVQFKSAAERINEGHKKNMELLRVVREREAAQEQKSLENKARRMLAWNEE